MMGVSITDIEEIICLQLGVHNISPDDRFIQDLGAESMDLVNIVAAVEDKFGISFEEKELASVRTTRELYNELLSLMPTQQNE